MLASTQLAVCRDESIHSLEWYAAQKTQDVGILC